MRLLIADTDAAAANALRVAARHRGHVVASASSAADVSSLHSFRPRVCIVTHELFAAADLIRESGTGEQPLIILTYEQLSASARLDALRAGVTDLVQKPLHCTEVVMRAEAHVELASSTPVAVPSRSAGDIEVQLEAYYAEKNGVPLRMTRLELRLLDCLVRSEGRLAPRAALLAAAWDQEDATPNPALLKTHISHLRTKLAEAGGLPVRIESRFGQGYVLSIR